MTSANEGVRTHGRATGIGGFFFRARDPNALTAWYADRDARDNRHAL